MAFKRERHTLGSRIRKKRIERGLTQIALAPLFHVSNDTLTLWELGKANPLVQHYPAIIAFLGYYPFDHEIESIGGKLKQLRYCNGYTIEQCGIVLGGDKFTVRNWEHYPYLCPLTMHDTIVLLWSQIPNQLKQQYRPISI
jgi:DNA-binding XRE family transcriptional regulator